MCSLLQLSDGRPHWQSSISDMSVCAADRSGAGAQQVFSSAIFGALALGMLCCLL